MKFEKSANKNETGTEPGRLYANSKFRLKKKDQRKSWIGAPSNSCHRSRYEMLDYFQKNGMYL